MLRHLHRETRHPTTDCQKSVAQRRLSACMCVCIIILLLSFECRAGIASNCCCCCWCCFCRYCCFVVAFTIDVLYLSAKLFCKKKMWEAFMGVSVSYAWECVCVCVARNVAAVDVAASIVWAICNLLPQHWVENSGDLIPTYRLHTNATHIQRPNIYVYACVCVCMQLRYK